ncbi:hypothetical protein L7F22_033696 [Adiantum nelumboides]|nr:hypothetical protein [Adiantum nelumboides]
MGSLPARALVRAALVFALTLACIVHYAQPALGAGAGNLSGKSMKVCRRRAATLCGPSAFTFHLHNIAYNPSVNNADNFTSVYGLPANVTWPSPYAFSTTSTFEDPLTSGPSVSSQQIGVANGFWHLTSKVGYTLFHIFTANITQGDYIGTIDIFGQLREADTVRDMTVIGGTGAFLGARGLASCRLVTIDRTPPACWTLFFDLDLYY